MTKQELDKIVGQLKSEGYSMDEVLAGFYKLFTEDKLSLDELEGIVNLLGYHLSDEFKKMSDDEKKKAGYGDKKGDSDDIEEEVDKNANGGKPVDKDSDSDDEDSEEEDSDSDDEDEEESEEEKKAMKLFGAN